MKWLKERRRTAEIELYIRVLGPLLAQRYLRSDTYRIGQVARALEESALGGTYAEYTYALYLSAEELGEALQQLDVATTVQELRSEIADTYFDGNVEFTATDVASLGDSVTSSGLVGDGGSE